MSQSFTCATCHVRHELGQELGEPKVGYRYWLTQQEFDELRRLAKEFDESSEQAGTIYSASEFLDYIWRDVVDVARHISVDYDTYHRRVAIREEDVA